VDVPGVGPLEVEAYQQRAYPGPVCAVHRAGRGELAWAAYRQCGDNLLELTPPQISGPDDLAERAPAGALFCGEIEPLLAAALRAREPEAPIVTGDSAVRWAVALAELGWRRYAAGARTQGAFVEPIYLREPNITKAKPRL